MKRVPLLGKSPCPRYLEAHEDLARGTLSLPVAEPPCASAAPPSYTLMRFSALLRPLIPASLRLADPPCLPFFRPPTLAFSYAAAPGLPPSLLNSRARSCRRLAFRGALCFDRTHGALARLHMRCSRVLTRNWLRSDSVRAATIPAVGLYLHDALRLGRAEGPLFKVRTTVPQSTHKSTPKKCPQCPNSTHPLAVGKGDAPTHGARPPLPLATKAALDALRVGFVSGRCSGGSSTGKLL